MGNTGFISSEQSQQDSARGIHSDHMVGDYAFICSGCYSTEIKPTGKLELGAPLLGLPRTEKRRWVKLNSKEAVKNGARRRIPAEESDHGYAVETNFLYLLLSRRLIQE